MSAISIEVNKILFFGFLNFSKGHFQKLIPIYFIIYYYYNYG